MFVYAVSHNGEILGLARNAGIAEAALEKEQKDDKSAYVSIGEGDDNQFRIARLPVFDSSLAVRERSYIKSVIDSATKLSVAAAAGLGIDAAALGTATQKFNRATKAALFKGELDPSAELYAVIDSQATGREIAAVFVQEKEAGQHCNLGRYDRGSFGSYSGTRIYIPQDTPENIVAAWQQGNAQKKREQGILRLGRNAAAVLGLVAA